MFQVVCQLDLLESDSHWNDTLLKANVFAGSVKLTERFAIVLVFCSISNPVELWLKYNDNFSEDIVQQIFARCQMLI